jgi:AcrR family transcriptional regulator
MREEVNAYKKTLILQAACDTFYEHGYHDTTVDMLAARLSGTKAIFYYYYPDKRAVLDELYRRTLVSALDVLKVVVSDGGTATEVLERFARRYTEWVIDNQKFVAVFWREERTLTKAVRIEIAHEQKRFDDGVAAIIRRGVDAGEFESTDPQSSSRAISGMVSFMYTWWRDGRRMTREAAADYHAELVLRLVRRT